MINNSSMIKKSVFWIFLFVLITGCGKSKIYEKHYKMENLSWNRFRVLEYDVDVKNASKNYDLFIAIRHITEIPYRKIDVGCTIVTPSGETRYLEHGVLIKDKTDALLGDGMGDIWDLVVPLRTFFRFDEAGISKIELSNRMVKLETLGIMEVGLIIRESD